MVVQNPHWTFFKSDSSIKLRNQSEERIIGPEILSKIVDINSYSSHMVVRLELMETHLLIEENRRGVSQTSKRLQAMLEFLVNTIQIK